MIDNVNVGKELLTIINVTNVPIKFKVDSGSCANVVPYCIVAEFDVRLGLKHMVVVRFSLLVNSGPFVKRTM